MPWVEVQFKGKQVWAECDAHGGLKVHRGRVPIRYSDKEGAKIYGGGSAGVSRASGAKLIELPPGQSADAAKKARSKKRGSGFGSAGTRTQAQAQAAKKSATEQLAALPEGTHTAFTDGSCRGNPGPCGAGAMVRLADGQVLEGSRYLGRGTNNVGELSAVGLAMELLDGAEVPPEAPVALFTDSQYSFGVLCKGWKAKANKELILKVRAQLKARPGVSIHWIAGHVGIDDNERADALANAAIYNR